jgi:hypothetical protein
VSYKTIKINSKNLVRWHQDNQVEIWQVDPHFEDLRAITRNDKKYNSEKGLLKTVTFAFWRNY